MGALPFTSVMAADVYPVLDSVTDPVAIGGVPPVPTGPITVTVTISDCAVVMLDAPGVTVTVGVLSVAAVTVRLTGADGLPLKFVSPL
jgi:hypothetical protein